MADRKVPSEPRVEELLATIRRAIDQDINELDRRAQESGQAPQRATPARSQPRAPAVTPPLRQPPRLKPDEPPPTPLRGTFHEFREKYRPDADRDIAQLRDRVKASRHEDPPPNPAQAPKLAPERTAAFSTILSRPARVAPQFRPPPPPEPLVPEAEEVPQQGYETYEPYDPAQWEQPPEQQAYYPPAVQQAYPEPEQPGLMSPDAAYAAHASFQALAQLALAQIGGDAGLQHMTRDVLTTLLREWLDRNLPPLVESLVREEIERVARGRR